MTENEFIVKIIAEFLIFFREIFRVLEFFTQFCIVETLKNAKAMKTQGTNTMFIKNTAGRVIGKFSFERIEAVAKALFYNNNVRESARVGYDTIAVTMKKEDVHSFRCYLKQFDVDPCAKFLQR